MTRLRTSGEVEDVDARFDASDLHPRSPALYHDLCGPVDTLDDALILACSVVEDYGYTPGNSRIERLARFLIARLGSRYPEATIPDLRLVATSLGDDFLIALDEDHVTYYSSSDARVLAAMLLATADAVESEI